MAKLDVAFGDKIGTFPFWLSAPTVPCFVLMGQDEVSYGTGGQGREDDEVAWILLAFVGIAEEKAAQLKLDEWMASTGEKSVRRILESRDEDTGRYLADVEHVYDVTVERATGNQLFTLPGYDSEVLGTQFTVSVRASE